MPLSIRRRQSELPDSAADLIAVQPEQRTGLRPIAARAAERLNDEAPLGLLNRRVCHLTTIITGNCSRIKPPRIGDLRPKAAASPVMGAHAAGLQRHWLSSTMLVTYTAIEASESHDKRYRFRFARYVRPMIAMPVITIAADSVIR